MNPKERLLTTLDHREPDKIPITAAFSRDTRMKLKRYYSVSSNVELNEKLGVEPFTVVIGVDPPTSWKPSKKMLEFYTATGYDASGQYAAYEEWGVERKLGLKKAMLLWTLGVA